MIPAAQERGALGALNAVLVQLRLMAGERNELAEILDWAEYLPRLLADDEDRSDEYRRVLVNLAGRSADFQLALQRFDQPWKVW